MAIALGNTNGEYLGTSSTSYTFSFNCGTPTNGVLVLGIFADTGDTITGITYAGNAMTQAIKSVRSGGGFLYIYYQALGSTSGANNIVVSYSASTDRGVKALVLTGAAQSSIIDTQDDTTTASGTNTLNYTITASNCWAVTLCKGVAVDPTVSTNVTQAVNPPNPPFIFGHSNAALGTGAQVQEWSLSSGGATSLGVVIKEFTGGGGGSTPMRLTLMGVS